MSSNGNVQLRDYSDREILAIMLDLGGEVGPLPLTARIYGWSAIQADDPGTRSHGIRCVTSRLSWMRRFGLVARDEDVWVVSDEGKRLMKAQLSQVVERAMARDLDDASLVLANRVGEKLVKAGEITGTAMRRELQFQITRRKLAR